MTDTPKTPKLATIRAMLADAGGTTLPRICATTGWQPHSARAVLSTLRKSGCTITREPGSQGDDAIYRLVGVVVPLAAG